ncbi:hypothetical protein B0T18DRAFT_418398 [Schizothecium vesticola]|uniref:Uncharacterized protein n=1 Tax=Schizothecium vesticola TaxID=314040 RepID=A0AA40JZ97_9PEZI|nr:hypothetical protein B0T18DRAFT_418398 [Schizothecium vesticola]
MSSVSRGSRRPAVTGPPQNATAANASAPHRPGFLSHDSTTKAASPKEPRRESTRLLRSDQLQLPTPTWNDDDD